jgi:L-threonylcarbamoyladenylate synthase
VRTEVLPVDAERPALAAIQRAAGVLRRGGLVAFPTETVYGLGADATSAPAVDAIFRAKERAHDDPLIVHVPDEDDARNVVAEWPPLAATLARACWPGPLTLVLERGPSITGAVSAGLPTVAVRVPSHPVAHALLAASGLPIAAPSANRFTRTSATTAGHVLEDLDGRINLVLDGGPATLGLESTVVSFEGQTVRVLRAGAVTMETLEAIVRPAGGTVVRGGGARGASPGLQAKHYAPRKPFVYVRGPGGPARRALAERARAEATAGRAPGLLIADEDRPLFDDLGERVVVVLLGSRDDPATMAHRLYAGLRELDRSGADVLLARSPGTGGLRDTIDDRLARAASERVDVRE